MAISPVGPAFVYSALLVSTGSQYLGVQKGVMMPASLKTVLQLAPDETLNIAIRELMYVEKLLKVVSSSTPSFTKVNILVPTAAKIRITMKVKTTEARACGADFVMVSRSPTNVCMRVRRRKRRNIRREESPRSIPTVGAMKRSKALRSV